MATLRGEPLRITTGSALAAAAVAEYWRGCGADAVDWLLRDDIRHDRPVLLFVRRPVGVVVHAAELIPGTPVSAHSLTCCDQPLHWNVLRVCGPELAEPCPACLAVARARYQAVGS